MIFRIAKTRDYTVMSNHHFKERTMSLKAKGLLSLMLSLPDDWDYSIEGLVKLSSDGETSLRSALKELEQFGYLKRERVYDKRGKICDWDYCVYEIPLLDVGFQQLENLQLENQVVENQSQLNTKELNTKKINTKELNTNKKEYTSKTPLLPSNDSYKDVQEIIEYYKQKCTRLPQPRVINFDRKKSVRNVIAKYGIEVVKEVLDKTAQSDFLNGSVGWSADFDWIFKEKNFIKILEGNYDNRKTKQNKDMFGEQHKVKTKVVTEQEKENARKFREQLQKNGEQVDY